MQTAVVLATAWIFTFRALALPQAETVGKSNATIIGNVGNNTNLSSSSPPSNYNSTNPPTLEYIIDKAITYTRRTAPDAQLSNVKSYPDDGMTTSNVSAFTRDTIEIYSPKQRIYFIMKNIPGAPLNFTTALVTAEDYPRGIIQPFDWKGLPFIDLVEMFRIAVNDGYRTLFVSIEINKPTVNAFRPAEITCTLYTNDKEGERAGVYIGLTSKLTASFGGFQPDLGSGL